MTVMLYKHPGDEHLPQHGGDFSLVIVNEGEVSHFLAGGWHRTPHEALNAGKPEPEPAGVDLPSQDSGGRWVCAVDQGHEGGIHPEPPQPEPAVIDLPEPDRSQIGAEPEPDKPKRRGRPRKSAE